MDHNASHLMSLLVQDFGKTAGSLTSPYDNDLLRCWCVQGATQTGLVRAFELAERKGWLGGNLGSWVITQAGVSHVEA